MPAVVSLVAALLYPCIIFKPSTDNGDGFSMSDHFLIPLLTVYVGIIVVVGVGGIAHICLAAAAAAARTATVIRSAAAA